MQIEIALGPDPLPPAAMPELTTGDVGAVVTFEGVVRGTENGRPIAALEYEAYQPMAEKVIRQVLEALGREHACHGVRVRHRLGVVPVGEAAIQVTAAAAHRAGALALVSAFMDRLKQEVPIWKGRSVPLTEPAAGAAEPPPAGAPSPATVANATPGAVRALVRRVARPLPAEAVPLEAAAGRVLREPVCAPEDQPPFDRAAMDGYAVRLDDPGPRFAVVDEIRAGDWKPRRLQPGEAVRIATGAALPGPGLQVIPLETVAVETGGIHLRARGPERHVRLRGEDAPAGQVLVEAGTVLTPGALALLASVGCIRPMVTRLPRVRHVVTGGEIVPPDHPPGPGQIRDSNSTLVRAFLAGWGLVPEQVRLGEDLASLQAALPPPHTDGRAPDLVLISGGVSVGRHDFTRAALEAAGFTLHVHKTAARPGRPLLVAQGGETLAFGLPGNPLAHFVCLHLYVRAALEVMLGRPPADFVTGRLAAPLAETAGDRETFWPARMHREGAVLHLTPLRWQSSGDLTALAGTNALLRVPAGAAPLAAGAEVQCLPTLPWP